LIPLSAPAPVVAGGHYAIVVYVPPDNASQFLAQADPNPGSYVPGNFAFSLNSGTTWAPGTQDLYFQTFVTQATLSVGNAQVTEGNSGTTNLVFPVSLSFAVGAAVTAPYTLTNGNATGGPACAPGVDFIDTGGTVTILAGSTTGTITARYVETPSSSRTRRSRSRSVLRPTPRLGLPRQPARSETMM
jgi:hypothetical protein